MAQPLVDISLLGDKELEKKLARLEGKDQRAAVRSSLTKSLTRIRTAVIRAAPVRTDYRGKGHPPGLLRAAFKATRARAAKRSRFGFGRVWPLPESSLLGIAPGDTNYWPAAVEYGHGNVPPKSFIRATVNGMEDSEVRQMGRDIGKGIERRAARK